MLRKINEKYLESIFLRFSLKIIYTIALCIFRHCQLIWAPKLNTIPKIFFEQPHENKKKLPNETLILEIQPVVFEKSVFKYGKMSLQITIDEASNARHIFRKTFVSNNHFLINNCRLRS